MTDVDLVRQTLEGNSEAFGQLVRRYQGGVQALAYHILGSFDDARDTAQEAFVQAFVKLDQLQEPERFGGWLRQTTVNCCRSLQRRREPVDLLENEPLSPDPSPEAVLAAEASRRVVHRSLGRLTARNRLVITLRYLGGLSYREIADFLDIPLSTVEGRMHRAKRELRGQLMDSVTSGLSEEQLPDDFARNVLDQALARARDARTRWDREDFVSACEEAMEVASRLQDGASQIDVLSMMGEAETGWLGKPEKAVSDYELALKVARDHQAKDGQEEIALLKSLALAHLRVADVERAKDRATEMLERSRALTDPLNETFAQAAIDLANRMPDFWKPGERGGYALAAFPLERTADGVMVRDPVGVRNYTFGCPCWCTAFVHLLPLKRFAGPSFALGEAWEEVVDPNLKGLGWAIETDQPLIARSTVQANAESVATPAGRFEGCVRVSTTIEPKGGGRAPGHTASRPRRICGRRQLWFAPGVGLVKLRHDDQEDNTWTVWLTAHSGETGDDLLPLDVGRWWRYRWWADPYQSEILDDLCRVFEGDGTVIHISSATCAKQEEKTNAVERLLTEAQLCRSSEDLLGEAASLEGVLAVHQIEERAPEVEWLERLESIYTTLGDEWKAAGVACRRADLSAGEDADRLSRYEARVDLARRLGDPTRTVEGLRNLAFKQREAGRPELSAGTFDEASAEAASVGDRKEAAQLASEADLSRRLSVHPQTDCVRYASGWVFMRAESTGRISAEICATGHIRPYPPGPAGTPMNDFPSIAPFMGTELLGADVGESFTDYWNVGTSPGPSESMRWTSIVKGKAESIWVGERAYENATLIETTVATSDEDKKAGPDTDRLRGYWAGRRKTWFVPGIGIVRLTYCHANGQVTDIELVDCDVKGKSGSPLPLTVGTRWDYRWTDLRVGTRYEAFVRVVSEGDGQCFLCNVTRATAEPASQTP